MPCDGQECVAARLPQELIAALGERSPPEQAWAEVLAVRTAAAADSTPPGPTIFGSLALRGSELVFRPRLPFLPGTEYVAALRLARWSDERWVEVAGQEERLRFRIPGPHRGAPEVVRIQPGSERVPANLLRAYVHFSAPMRTDVAGRYLGLFREDGTEVEMPFVEIEGGLWDPEQTRLTLLFHPGRLKRGVAPRERMGPPLREGERYTLVIEPGWPAATGEPLRDGAQQSWKVGPPDREPVRPATWRVEAPRAGTLEPVRVALGQPLDSALALRLIRPAREERRVAGRAELDPGQREWSFVPEEPWEADDYLLRVAPSLEDLAGNNLRGAFDREPEEAESAPEEAVLRFRPR